MMTTEKQKTKPWYASGLNFTCTGYCGACCTGSGRVWLNEREIYKIAELLEQDVAELVEQAIERREESLDLERESPKRRLSLLQDRRCTIYQARPQQCQGFPWWPSTLKSEASWEEAKRVCEGIDHEEAQAFFLCLRLMSNLKPSLRVENLGNNLKSAT